MILTIVWCFSGEFWYFSKLFHGVKSTSRVLRFSRFFLVFFPIRGDLFYLFALLGMMFGPKMSFG